MSNRSGIYVFCAIREKEPKEFGSISINGEDTKVYTIHFQNIAIVVSKANGEVLPDRNNLLSHQQTVSKVMKQFSVIPMSFGNVFHSEEDVILITKHLEHEFEKLFLEIENKIEVGLKVIVKKEWIEQEINKDPVLNQWKIDKKRHKRSRNFL